MTSDPLIDALRRPSAYPRPPDRVDVLRTHISVLFFAGDRVYKVKRPVDLGFLDYRPLERRRFFCHEEVRLNRRLAAGVYLGVVPITRADGGPFRVGEPGDDLDSPGVVEYAVAMRRLPADRMLDRLLAAGVIDNAAIDEIAEVLLRFHGQAATGPGVDEHGEPDAVERAVRRNLDELEPFVGPGATLSARLHARLRAEAAGFVGRHRVLFASRVRDGRIRDGHGDLHAGNICLTADGVVIYDCIEFAPGLRCGDVAKDVAFLVMDLDGRGWRGFGRYLARRYAAGASDPDLQTLLPFYKAHLACVRGKVHSIEAADESAGRDERSAAMAAARRYVQLAAAYGLPPAVIGMCGPPGSGKSWTARRIARPFDALVVRSDAVRKRLAGVPPTARPTGSAAAALYSPDMSRRTYETVVDEARQALAGGRTVVADATFPTAAARRRLADMAASAGAPLVFVYLDPPRDVIAARLGGRAADAGEVSDADWDVYRRLEPRFEPPAEIADAQLVESPGTGEPELITAAVIERLIGQACGDG